MYVIREGVRLRLQERLKDKRAGLTIDWINKLAMPMPVEHVNHDENLFNTLAKGLVHNNRCHYQSNIVQSRVIDISNQEQTCSSISGISRPGPSNDTSHAIQSQEQVPNVELKATSR